MNQFSDEQLVAFVDDEAEPELQQAIQQALPQDAQLSQRVEAMRASRQFLQQAFAGSDSAALARLEKHIQGQRVRRQNRWRLPLALAAAGLLLALLVPLLSPPVPGGSADFVSLAIAQPFVQRGLESRASGDLSRGEVAGQVAELMPTASWLTQSRQFCRSFELSLESAGEVHSGWACRQPDAHWVLASLQADTPASAAAAGQYRPASAAADAGLRDARQLNPREELQALLSAWEKNFNERE